MELFECGWATRLDKLTALSPWFHRPLWGPPVSTVVYFMFVLAVGCGHPRESLEPSISFIQVPPAAMGGADVFDRIGGRVLHGEPGARIVLYTQSKGTWFIQPFRSHALTEIEKDGSWENVTHLGTDYAALLVTPGYRPPTAAFTLPSVGGSVLAVAMTKGSAGRLPDPKTVQFSGYDWKIRSFANDRGGKLCAYEPSSTWVDDRGYLHLLIKQNGIQWHCAGISLTRSLGYGTYRFLVSDSTNLPPSVVLSIFTRADRQDENDKIGFSTELSQWGKSGRESADFVLQPYYIPGNTARFGVPLGPMTFVLRWDPGSAAFSAFAGDSVAARRKVAAHVFNSGVPVPATETIHLEFYDFQQPHDGLQHQAEIVVQRFEYLP